MARGKPKVLKFIDTLKRGYNSLLGKELAGAINKKAIAGVKAIPGFKKGGVVKRTGVTSLLHKGEVVLSVAQRKALKKMLH